MDSGVTQAIEHLRHAPDVQHIAVMPDVHLSADVCIGVAVATSSLIYPQAVGGDLGCGMLAVALNVEAADLRNPKLADQLLDGLRQVVPARRHNRNRVIPLPEDLQSSNCLSSAKLEYLLRRGDGVTEFGTLGSGNHFVEIQGDDEDRLWLMVHSGSRALGQAIRDHHLARAEPVTQRLRALDSKTEAGQQYLNDVRWARRYADTSRKEIARAAGDLLGRLLGAAGCTCSWETLITTDHNHVSQECHFGRQLCVHRKGAMSAQPGESGVLPGSMGTLSFHVEGRGNQDALCSSAHGAGRKLSRTAARAGITEQQFRRQMEGVWYETRLAAQLRDEAPSAYKDIRAVLRAQRDLVKVTRTLRPLLNYKGV
jgi:tRNA-splicing ligase RtcB (3'-phosphate/5'-hydroxy nucleic acid ligase)